MLGCGRGQAAGPGCWPFPVAPRGSAGQRGAAGREPVAGAQIQAPPLAGLGGCFASRSLSFFINKTGTARECKDNASGAAVFLSPVGDRSPEGRAAWGVLPFWPAGITFAILLCARLDFLSRPASVYTRTTAIVNCVWSVPAAGWMARHTRQSVITASWGRLRSLWPHSWGSGSLGPVGPRSHFGGQGDRLPEGTTLNTCHTALHLHRLIPQKF